MKFNPPIESRETEELIIISKSTTDEYQQEAISVAKQELVKRGMSQLDIDKAYDVIMDEYDKLIEIRDKEIAVEDYSLFEKLWIIISWPRELFNDWSLKREGYLKKSRNRIKLIAIGIALYFIIIAYSTL